MKRRTRATADDSEARLEALAVALAGLTQARVNPRRSISLPALLMNLLHLLA